MADAFTQYARTDHDHDEISLIVDILQGPETLGGGRDGGLVADVSDNGRRLADMSEILNGGVDATLSVTQKVAIIAAGIGGLASIVSALILT